MAIIWNKRKDLDPPCGYCPDKHIACMDKCEKEEFKKWVALQKARKADSKKRHEAERYDVESYYRRKQ